MKRKILFVDDDRNILDGFRTMLHSKRREWKCRFAESGEQGLELIDKEPFDVVIADMRMPGMDGADFLEVVSECQPGAIRIILSGYSEMQVLLKSVKHAHQFLSKPCGSDTIIETIRRVMALGHILNDESIRKLVSRLSTLPVIPGLYVRICRELEVPEPDLKRIGRMVEQDAGMSTTLMKVVNSSFFGFYEKVSSPARAVTLLGIEAVKGLVLGVRLMQEINLSSTPGYSVEKLWRHTLQTGYLAKEIARLESADDALVENCFIAGMLHDVGKLIFVTQMTDMYRPVLESVRRESGPIFASEKELLGVTHAEVGAYLLGLWGFKPDVVNGVHAHHAPWRCPGGLTPALVVHAANSLQHEIGFPESDFVFSPMYMDHLEQQGFAHRLDSWRAACKEKMEHL